MPIGFSTVATPDLTLDRVARLARETGADGVELRWFDGHSPDFACDPSMTAPRKVRAVFEEQGVAPASLATSARFCHRVWPPVIGRAFCDEDIGVRQTKRAVEYAAAIGAPFVRVFGFELPTGETKKTGTRRVVERLRLAAASARNTGVRVVIENGGTYPTAADLAELIDRADTPLLGASYNTACAHAAGESAADGVRTLADRLLVLKVKDASDGVPRRLGAGDVTCECASRLAAKLQPGAWQIFEWDRAWMPELEAPEPVIRDAIASLSEWTAVRLAAAGAA